MNWNFPDCRLVKSKRKKLRSQKKVEIDFANEFFKGEWVIMGGTFQKFQLFTSSANFRFPNNFPSSLTTSFSCWFCWCCCWRGAGGALPAASVSLAPIAAFLVYLYTPVVVEASEENFAAIIFCQPSLAINFAPCCFWKDLQDHPLLLCSRSPSLSRWYFIKECKWPPIYITAINSVVFHSGMEEVAERFSHLASYIFCKMVGGGQTICTSGNVVDPHKQEGATDHVIYLLYSFS